MKRVYYILLGSTLAAMILTYFFWWPRGFAFAATGMVAVVWSAIPRNHISLLPGPTPPRICPKYGYDLRATPDRCPECGTLPAEFPRKPR